MVQSTEFPASKEGQWPNKDFKFVNNVIHSSSTGADVQSNGKANGIGEARGHKEYKNEKAGVIA